MRPGSSIGAFGSSRRTVLAGLAAGAVLGPAWPAAARRPDWQPSGRLTYRVSAGGGEVGRLEIAFEAEGDRLTARTTVEIAVSLAFLTAWSYHHDSVETWQGDRLVAFSSTTDDDGRPHTLQGTAAEDGFRLASTRDGAPYLSETAPAGTAPASYWRRDVLDRPVLFDPQSGSLHPQRILGSRRETIEAAGRPIPAIAYNVEARHVGWVWYEETGRWLAARLTHGDIPISHTLIG